MKKPQCSDSFCARAFTLIDLVVVLGMLAFALVLLAPALARTRPNSQSIQCLNNTCQLIGAWQMYSAENNGKPVVNVHGGSAQGGAGDATWGMSWAEGWLDWAGSTDNTNIALLLNPRYARLAPYLILSSPRVFQCPADTYVSWNQRAYGWNRRCRSYSASLNVGSGNAATGPFDSIYRQVTKDTDFCYPGPADTFVFVDEHPDSINDPGFFSPHSTSWIDLPGTLHNGAGGFAFADGHSELHKWNDSLTKVRSVQFSFTAPTPSPADRDIRWLSYHSARLSTNSF